MPIHHHYLTKSMSTCDSIHCTSLGTLHVEVDAHGETGLQVQGGNTGVAGAAHRSIVVCARVNYIQASQDVSCLSQTHKLSQAGRCERSSLFSRGSLVMSLSRQPTRGVRHRGKDISNSDGTMQVKPPQRSSRGYGGPPKTMGCKRPHRFWSSPHSRAKLCTPKQRIKVPT